MEDPCSGCGKNNYVEVITPELPHYGKLICAGCGMFIKWLPKPDNTSRRSSTKWNIDLSECKICGRRREHLGARETIGPHHLKPIEEGGLDEEKNLLALCTACHRLVHWARLYVGRHMLVLYGKTEAVFLTRDDVCRILKDASIPENSGDDADYEHAKNAIFEGRTVANTDEVLRNIAEYIGT